MLSEVIEFSEDSFLKAFIIERSSYIQCGTRNTWQPEQRPAVIIMPGGGYQYIADSEDDPVVFHFLAKGYNVFSLHYSVGDKSRYPIPLLEAFNAIQYVRLNSDRYWTNPEAIILCGFSAGAHLAGLAATQYNLPEIIDSIEATNIKPNAVILCYPVTNPTRLHEEIPKRTRAWGSMLSEKNDKVDIVRYVSEEMPPTFLWHTRTDGIVPVTQSIELIDKMVENNVNFEAHIFGKGHHGLSTNDVLSNYRGAIQGGIELPNVGLWIEMASKWVNDLFDF